MNNIERTDRVVYQLYNRVLGPLFISEPQGWQDDFSSMERDKDSMAVETTVDINLKFYGEAAEYLKSIYDAYGVSQQVIISKFELEDDTIEERVKNQYVQEIQMGEFKYDHTLGEVSVKATEGGLYLDIKDRVDDEYDLMKNESADGDDIGDFEFAVFQPVEREVFIESSLKADVTNYRVNSSDYRESYSDVYRTVPLYEEFNSDKEDVYAPAWATDTYNDRNHQERNYIGDIQLETQGNAFFYRATQNKNVTVNFDMTFTIDRVDADHTDNETFRVFYFITEISEDGRDRIIGEQEYLNIGNPIGKEGNTYTITDNRTFDLLEGQSIVIAFNVAAKLGGFFRQEGHLDVYLSIISSMQIIDNTTFPTTPTKCIKPLTLFDRLVAKITGKTGLVRSSLFEEGGKYEGMVVNNGLMARGFPDSYEDSNGDEQKYQFNTSFKDAFEAYNYLEPLCWYVDVEGRQQVVRIESAKHTQQNFIGIDLGPVDDVVSESLIKDHFRTIEIGHSKDLEYEEINGLDEPNGLSKFSTYIKRGKGEYKSISPYRFDSIGYELVRRKSFEAFPKADTFGDDDIWMHDAKFVNKLIFPFFGGIYVEFWTHKTWVDLGYDAAPTGIFSPNTAWNLDLSPMNRLRYHHGYSVKRSLFYSSGDKIYFSGSNANQNLKTLKNGILLHEGGSLFNGDLETNRVEPTKMTMEFQMTQEIEQQFKGKRTINGLEVPNVFGLIRFEYNGIEQYGRIIKLTNKNKTKLEIIKAGL